ncbi:MAG: thiamine pyrophosphate-dependent enzyme [Ilumatobacter sp.]|uniref:thiamine pyrophosphate-dependent enzyme n=1 Tax=Ilumatobacter sp. TaxID=1967498 RepID=UPI00391DBA46
MRPGRETRAIDPSKGTPRTGGTVLAEQLVSEGTEVVFGVPGAQLDHAVDGLARLGDTIRFVHTRHEQGAGYMADGYARTTGRPGVMMVVPGPGLLNASAALATAWACSSPVVALVGAIPTWARDRHAGVLHELGDQSAIVRELAGWHRMVDTADSIPAAIADAFAAARSGRPRPAAVEIPADVLAHPTSAATVAPLPTHHPAPSPNDVAATAALLNRATFPVIVAGSGVTAADAGEALIRLAERIDAPVILTTNGKAATAHDHPLVVPQPVGRDLLPQADVVLAVGTRLANAVGRPVVVAPEADLVLVNADEVDLGGWRRPTVALHADAGLALSAIVDAVTDGTVTGTGRRDSVSAITEARTIYERQIDSIRPLAEFVDAIGSAMPSDGIVVADLTQVGYLANAIMPVATPRSYLTSGWQGTLGFSYPTALGAKVAHPDRAVVAIIGDGGMGFTMSEMATAARHGIATIAVCFRDDAFGNVRRTQREVFDERYLGTDLKNPDFVAVASAHGLRARRAASAAGLELELRLALEHGAPALIEVAIGEVPSPWHLFAEKP